MADRGVSVKTGDRAERVRNPASWGVFGGESVLLDSAWSLHSAPCDGWAENPGSQKRLAASVAQLAEQLICNQPVVGSNPSAGSCCTTEIVSFCGS